MNIRCPKSCTSALYVISSTVCLCAPLAAYTPKSEFLQQPEKILPFLSESTDFWKAAWDEKDGAFFSEVNLDGTPRSQLKAFLSQSRNAYAFSKAFMVTGDRDYLEYADGALRFMYQHGWDAANGGWWGQMELNGSINTGRWYNNSRWSFWQHYMLLGPTALYEANGDPFHKDWIDRGNAVNDEKMWDNRPGLEGYFADSSLNWSSRNDKGFTPTVDAVTTSALTNFLMEREPLRLERLQVLGDNILYMIEGDHGHVVSFPSSYNNDWVVRASARETSIGHHIKTAWCLARIYLMDPDPAYRLVAEKLLDQIWSFEGSNGLYPWDHDNGIMRGRIDVFNGAVGGSTDWWTVEQGVTGALIAWYVSRKPEYLQMADEALSFFMEHYYDYENGEVFKSVTNTGFVVDRLKGDMFKAGYHSVELFYLVYLYGNLYYKNQPVTLNYHLDGGEAGREVQLWPLAYEDDRLLISSVLRDGQPYANWEAGSRTLQVAAGGASPYSVTFESRFATNPPGQFDRGWWLDWIGWYFHDNRSYPWVYHAELGWLYLIDNAKNRTAWAFRASTGDYYFISGTHYPKVYHSGYGWVESNLNPP